MGSSTVTINAGAAHSTTVVPLLLRTRLAMKGSLTQLVLLFLALTHERLVLLASVRASTFLTIDRPPT